MLSKLNRFLQIIEEILICKLPQCSREELEAMLGLSDIKQTRVYQEGRQEGRQEGLEQVALKLLEGGMSVDQVQQFTSLSLQRIQELHRSLNTPDPSV